MEGTTIGAPMNPTAGTMALPKTDAVPPVPALHRAIAMAQPAAVQRSTTMQTLVAEWAQRTARTGAKAMTLAPFSLDPQVVTEWLQLQSAIAERLQSQQQVWLQGWALWLEERAQVRRANTMSKLMEQEMDLLGRFVLLLSGQMVDLVTLQENVEVNTGYWVSQTLAEKTGDADVV